MSERRLSPSEVLATLVDGAPTEGDIAMLTELRAGLRAHAAGPAKVAEGPALGPLDPEMAALLDRRARQRLRSPIDMKPPPAAAPSTRRDPPRSADLGDDATIDGDLGGGDPPAPDEPGL